MVLHVSGHQGIFSFPTFLVRRGYRARNTVFRRSPHPQPYPANLRHAGNFGGVAFGAGYGIGVLWRWLWHYLELPEPQDRLRSRANLVVGLVCLAVAVVALYFAAGWQNSVRAVMDMEPVPSAYPMSVSALAVLTFLVLLILVRLLILLGKFVSAKVQLIMPRRLANVWALRSLLCSSGPSPTACSSSPLSRFWIVRFASLTL